MKLFKRFAVCLICAVIAFVAISGIIGDNIWAEAKTNAELQKEIDALNGKMDSINDQKKALQSKINSAKSTAKTLAGEITDLTYEIDLLDEQIIIIQSMLEQYDVLIEEQKVLIEDLTLKIEKQQKMLDEMIRMSFEYGGTVSTIEFIFSAEDFSDLLTRIDLLSYHLKYNNKVIESYNDTLNTLEKTKLEYENALVSMNEYMAEQEDLKVQLEKKQAIAQTKRAQVLANASEYEKELKEKQVYIDELNAEIKRLAEMFAKEDKTTYSGQFLFPLPQGVYRTTSYYGYRKDPLTGKTAYHNGYDFACAKGTKIYAVDDGTVVIANWNGGYGNCVTINHGGGIMTLYGHCSSLNVVSGQKVKRGDVIAYVGSTGRSTGNHLHFTVYKNGALADPAPYLGI